MEASNEAFGPRSTRIHDLGDGRAVLYLRGEGSRRTVPSYLAAILTRLRGFRTLEGHARRLVEEGEAPGVREALVHLEDLADEGLLVPASEYLRTVPGSGEGEATGRARIERMAWLTRDRPGTVLESVRGFAEGLRGSERRPEIVVADDSRDPSSTATLRDGLRELAGSTGLAVSYLGPEERESMIRDLLAASGAQEASEEVIRFGVGNPEGLDWTVGAARNALMLTSPGQPMLLTDDDVFCRIVEPAERLRALRVASTSDPTEFLALGDEARGVLDGEDSTEWFRLLDEPENVLERHEAFLGRTLGDGAEGEDRGAVPLDLEELDQSFARHLSRHGGAVRVTTPGVAGDSGMGHPAGLLRLEGPGREELTWSEELYEEALLSRRVVRIAEPGALIRGGYLLGAQLGLDLRTPLPPFFPVLRNSDGIYAATLRAGLPGVLTAHLPWALRHEPPEARRFSRDEVPSFRHRFCNVLMLLLHEASADGSSPEDGVESEEALKRLGTRLVEIASLAPPAFRERIELLWLQEAEGYLATLEALLQRHGFQPPYWAEDVEAHLEEVRAYMAESDPAIPMDLAAGRDPTDADPLRRVMRLVRRFGELLRVWPGLLDTARELRDGGRRWAVEP